MSQDKFNSIIDVPALTEEQKATLALLKELKSQFVDTASGVIKLNEALFGANSSKTFAQSARAVTDGLEQINTTQRRVVDTEAKAAAQREKQMNAYLVQLSKEQAERDKAEAKEVAAAQKRLDRIAKEQAALDAAAAKRKQQLNEDDPRFSRPGFAENGGLFETDTKTISDAEIASINAKKEALIQEAAALRGTVEAQQARTASSQKATATSTQENSVLMEAINDNIRLKAQLKEVETQIKATTTADAGLIAEQARLKAAISANTSIIGQSAKQENAAAGSADALNARLAQLRAGYNALSKEERENVAVGGVFLSEIKELDKQTKEIAESQGLYNKSVGDYENKIKSAISAYIPYGSQLVKGIDTLKAVNSAQGDATSSLSKLGLTFASFTVAAFAAAIALAVNYLNQFQGLTDKIDISLSSFKGRVGAIGQQITDAFKQEQDAKPSIFKQYIQEIEKVALSLNPLQQVANVGVKSFKDSTQAVADNAEAAAKAGKKYEDLNDVISLNDKILQGQVASLRAQARDKSLSVDQQVSLLDKAAIKEREIITNQTKLGEEAVKLAIQTSNIYGKLTKSQIDALEKGDLALATSLNRGDKITKIGFELYKEALNKRQDALNSSVATEERIKSLRDSLELRGAKKQAADLIKIQEDALAKRIEKAKAEASALRSVGGNGNNTDQVRAIAIDATLKKENEIADLEAKKAKLRNKNTIEIDQAANAQKLLNKEQYNVAVEKLENDALKAGSVAIEKSEAAQLEILKTSYSDKITQIEQFKNEALEIEAERYAKGEINQTQYNRNVFDITKQAAQDTLEAQIDAAQKVVDFDVKNLRNSADDEKTLADLKIKLAKQISDVQISESLRVADARKRLNEVEKEVAEEVVTFIQSVVDARYEAAKNQIDEQKNVADSTAKSQIDAENRSLDSAKTKQEKIDLINAQTQAKKEQLDKQARKIDHDKAVFDREIAIARITEETAIAVIKAAADFIFPFNLIIGAAISALGALQIATVLSTPLPAFAKGGTHRGGAMVAGELGTELMIDPSGRLGLTPDKATIMSAPAGTKIIDHAKTMKILANPERVQYVGGQQIDISELVGVNREMLKEMKNKPVSARSSHNYRDWGSVFRNYVN